MPAQFLIAGGGIAGFACALALGQRGHRIDLFEQAEAFGEFGAGIQLGPNATRRLRALGLRDGLNRIAARPAMLRVRSAADGLELARLPFDDGMRQRYGAPYLCVHRADLHGLLRDATRTLPRMAASEGVRIQKVATRGGELVCVSSTDSRAWEGDALIGADGLWSTVRRQVVEDDVPPRATGHTAWRALVPQSALPPALRSNRVDVWLGARLHAVAYPVRGGDWLNLVVLAEAGPGAALEGDARDWDRQTSLAALQAATGQVGAGLQALLEAMPQWRAWTLSDRAPVPGPQALAHERVVLVGDAAHPMLPYMAQGAGMAIEDALALADAVGEGDAATLPPAFIRYAEQRWARCARVQARARRNGEIFHATGATRLGRDLAMRLLGARLLDVPWLYAG